MSQALYRWFDRDGRLLYVGISRRIGARNKEHEQHSDWSQLAHFVTLEWHDSRSEVERAEIRAIQNEHPIYNVDHRVEGTPLQIATPNTWSEVKDLRRMLEMHRELWNRQLFIEGHRERVRV